MPLSTAYSFPAIPTEADAKLSQESSRILASHLRLKQQKKQLKVVEEDGYRIISSMILSHFLYQHTNYFFRSKPIW